MFCSNTNYVMLFFPYFVPSRARTHLRFPFQRAGRSIKTSKGIAKTGNPLRNALELHYPDRSPLQSMKAFVLVNHHSHPPHNSPYQCRQIHIHARSSAGANNWYSSCPDGRIAYLSDTDGRARSPRCSVTFIQVIICDRNVNRGRVLPFVHVTVLQWPYLFHSLSHFASPLCRTRRCRTRKPWRRPPSPSPSRYPRA